MKTRLLYIAGCVLALSTLCRASELEPALKPFAAYDFGQAKKVLHDTRMTAYRGTDDEALRKENERLLLAFIESDASVISRREACLWLSDLGTEISQPALTRLLNDPDFTDVAQIALDALKEREAVSVPSSANNLAQFKSEVMASAKPADRLTQAMVGEDEARARAAFGLVADGVAQPEVLGWVKENMLSLEPSRQVVALNLLVPVGASELSTGVKTLSREGQAEARLAAIRHLGTVGSKQDATYLVELFCGADAPLAQAAEVALRTMPEDRVRGTLLGQLNSDNPALQAKAIQVVELRGSALAADELWRIAEQNGHANQKAAIKTWGKTAPASEFGRLLDWFINPPDDPAQKEWKMAVWDLSRRQPDYQQAAAVLKSKQENASAEAASILASLTAKLETIQTADTPNEITPAPAPAKIVAPVAYLNTLLPGSYSDIIPKRFEVAAYLNCGPGKQVKQNGVSIECANGKPFNSGADTDPSLSVLFSTSTLDFNLTGLEPGQEYVLGMTWWDVSFNERWQSIWINGKEVLPTTRAMAFDEHQTKKSSLGRPTPTRIQFALQSEQFEGGTCRISIKGIQGPNVVASELWVAKRKQPRAEKQVLLISGQDFPGHHWRKTGPVMEAILNEDTRMEVTICETPYVLGLKHLDAYDLIVAHFKNYEDSMPSTQAMQDNLKSFVMNGGGLCMSHFACGAFMEWPDFVNLSGRIWSRGGHDPRGPFTVKVVDQTHPVTRGLGAEFQTDDELYWCLTGEPDIHLLCDAMSTMKKARQPQALVFEPGKGRTFLCTLGHDVKAYDADKVKQLYRQGAAWAAGLD